MNIKIFSSIFFCSLLLCIPINVDAKFTYESCRSVYDKIKMIKNNSDGSRIYCVSIETAKILEQRGWGTSDHNYFHTEIERGDSNKGGIDRAYWEYSIDENYSDAFMYIMDSCPDWVKQNIIKSNPMYHWCDLTFYNGTVLHMDVYGNWNSRP